MVDEENKGQEEEEDLAEERRARRMRRQRDEVSLEDMAEAYFERAKGVVPEDFVSHMRAARKEFLLAVRSLLDAHIERLDEAEQRKAGRRPTRVRID